MCKVVSCTTIRYRNARQSIVRDVIHELHQMGVCNSDNKMYSKLRDERLVSGEGTTL